MSKSNTSTLRLLSDWKALQAEAPEGISASPLSDDNLYVWEASIVGPDETPWEGGIFSLTIKCPLTYPDRPPTVRFTTEMFHPNVFQDGTLCLDIIQDQWKPVYTIGTVLTSVQSLLTDPFTGSPANPEASKLFENDKKEYNRRVRQCAQRSVG
mmetsp:Transcript_42490/g.83765  ORF Transcript_42490/g.83765 Transcript_42490/m.83765 type:complete len:154 (-) Transcript_42490:1209-1670(-)